MSILVLRGVRPTRKEAASDDQTDTVAETAGGWRTTIARWIARSRQRRVLREIAESNDRHLLRDIGVSRQEAFWEADKPFWRR
jgi:uncharacterized protein YjiS (DUF1127 family)